MHYEWCVLSCGSKNGLQKHMCLSEGGQYAENLLTILGSIVNMIGLFHFAHV